MISEYFFLNCWSADVESDNTAFREALRLSEIALNPLSVENTSEKSFQKAELTYGRKRGQFCRLIFWIFYAI